MAKTSLETQEAIKDRLLAGESCRQVAEALGVSKSLVGKIRKTLPEDTPGAKPGPKPKLTTSEKRYVVSLVKRDRARTAVEATRIVNEGRQSTVSAQTVR